MNPKLDWNHAMKLKKLFSSFKGKMSCPGFTHISISDTEPGEEQNVEQHPALYCVGLFDTYACTIHTDGDDQHIQMCDHRRAEHDQMGK